MKNEFPTPEELAQEAREALSRRPTMTPREHFIWMVRKGLINARGQATKLIGGSAEPEPDYQMWTAEEDVPIGRNGPQGQGRSAEEPGSAKHPR